MEEVIEFYGLIRRIAMYGRKRQIYSSNWIMVLLHINMYLQL